MPSYTAHGPFNNGSAPGIDASFLNAVETWIGAMADATTSNSAGTWTFVGVVLSNNHSVAGKDTGGVARDLIYVDGANATDIQAAALGGLIIFKDRDGTTHAAISMANNSLQIGDSGHVLKDIIYVDNANSTHVQLASGAKLFVSDSSGGSLMSIDSSGNMRVKGTVTASVTP